MLSAHLWVSAKTRACEWAGAFSANSALCTRAHGRRFRKHQEAGGYSVAFILHVKPGWFSAKWSLSSVREAHHSSSGITRFQQKSRQECVSLALPVLIAYKEISESKPNSHKTKTNPQNNPQNSKKTTNQNPTNQKQFPQADLQFTNGIQLDLQVQHLPQIKLTT